MKISSASLSLLFLLKSHTTNMTNWPRFPFSLNRGTVGHTLCESNLPRDCIEFWVQSLINDKSLYTFVWTCSLHAYFFRGCYGYGGVRIMYQNCSYNRKLTKDSGYLHVFHSDSNFLKFFLSHSPLSQNE